jgi:hypothetical protein
VALLLDLDDDEAFLLLRRRSNTTNVPLRDVARHLLDQARAMPPEQRLSPGWLADVLAPAGDRQPAF